MVLGLVAIMMAFGAWFFMSTVQSKNVFQIFFRADATRIIAESALAEWRATFLKKRIQEPGLRNLLENPSLTSPITISLSDLPHTQTVGDNLNGRGNWFLDGEISIHAIDDLLMENVGGIQKRGTFGKEYQGILRLQFTVGFGERARPSSSAHFSYDFDLKLTSLRSSPQDRINQGYTTDALNDYVLYIRGGKNEFQFFNVWNQRNIDRTLTIAHSSAGMKGKVFWEEGPNAATMEATGRILFADQGERLLISPPDPPLIGRAGPVHYSRFLPFASAQMRFYEFLNSDELFSSPLFQDNTLHLNGIYFVRNGGNGLVIPKGTTFTGRGVLISLGNISIEGSFTKKSPTDGPCFLYTWVGNITANAVEQGRIEASLIALRYNYDPYNQTSPVSTVSFSQRKADVLGGLLVDQLNLKSMAASEDNTITYDSNSLSGPAAFSYSVGGQLRGMNATYRLEENN